MASRTRVRSLVDLVAVLTVAAVLTACGGDDTGSSGRSTSAPTSSVPSSPASSPASPAPSGGAVAAATGPVITMPTFTFHLPEGWQVEAQQEVSAQGADPHGNPGTTIQAFDLVAFSTDSLDSLARDQVRLTAGQGVNPTRQDDRTVNGVEGYVITGSSDLHRFFYQFGTKYQDTGPAIVFQFDRPPADPQQIVESVLASIQWK